MILPSRVLPALIIFTMSVSDSRQRDMNELFEKIKLYCGILRKCSSPEVGRWGEEDVDRAFHWADYFDKVS